MAQVIGHAVVRGELDNTVEGLTTGRIWMMGRPDTIVLRLHGDCWRDLAGCRVEFENPNPEAGPPIRLESLQNGLVGDITASRRCRGRTGAGPCPELAVADESPEAWRNYLYIEWFSEADGRVVIESDRFELRLGDPKWRMDADAEQAQKLANLQAMRDYLARVVRRGQYHGRSPRGGAGSEYDWEELLKLSDRLDAAYEEAIEKYHDDPDSDQKEAFVMGWDSLLQAMAGQHAPSRENQADPPEDSVARIPGQHAPSRENQDGWEESESTDFSGDSPSEGGGEDGDGIDGGFDLMPDAGEADPHPMREFARELAQRAYDLAHNQDPESEPGDRLIANMSEVRGKLAGVLRMAGGVYQPETGFVLAVLKRSLQFINEAMAACRELIRTEEDPDHKHALQALLEDIFELRGQIVELRRDFRK